MALVYSYRRFSSILQEKGRSLKRQADNATKFVEKHGHTLDLELNLTDSALSAFRGDNAKTGRLGAFLEAIKLGKVKAGSILYVESLDRVSRQNLDESLEIFRQIVRAGVVIHTASPERSYDRESLKSLIGLIEPLVVLSRAHEESATKSGRIKDAIAKKRTNLDSAILTAACPSWCQPKPDRSGFTLIQSKVKVIREIFEMSVKGLGFNAITRYLNQNKVPPISRGKDWQMSYVRRLLNNRSLLGEFQPMMWNEEQQREPIGKLVKNYFPPVISEELFYAAQSASDSRKGKRGRTGIMVANLFQGLIKDKNGDTLKVANKGKNDFKRIISEKATRGIGEEFPSIQYPFFEECLLRSIKELQASDLTKVDVIDNREAIKGKISEVENKIEVIKQKVKTNPDIDSLLDLLRELGEERKALLSELEAEQNKAVSNQAASLSEAQSLIQLLSETKAEDLFSVRSNLRQQLRNIIQVIYVIVDKAEKKTVVTAKIVYKDQSERLISYEATKKKYIGMLKVRGLTEKEFNYLESIDKV